MEALLSQTRNVLGNPLPADMKALIKDFLLRPSAQTWDKAARVIIKPGLRGATLWAQVCRVDPSFPSKLADGYGRNTEDRWPRIPSVFVVARAIREANQK